LPFVIHGWPPATTRHTGRILNRASYVRFRHWRLYGERGLAGDAVAVWLYGEHLTIAFDEALAQYGITCQPDQRQLATVVDERRFETPCQSSHLALWAPQSGAWLTVPQVAPYALRCPRAPSERYQLRLLTDETHAIATG
jgi:hypothetical protein